MFGLEKEVTIYFGSGLENIRKHTRKVDDKLVFTQDDIFKQPHGVYHLRDFREACNHAVFDVADIRMRTWRENEPEGEGLLSEIPLQTAAVISCESSRWKLLTLGARSPMAEFPVSGLFIEKDEIFVPANPWDYLQEPLQVK